MRSALRALALVSLAACALGLAVDISVYRNNPCPARLFFQLFLVLFGGLVLLPALFGSVVAVGLAAARRQWVWLAGVLLASVSSLVFLTGAEMDHPPAWVKGLTNTLAWAGDHALGLTTCGSRASPYVQASAVLLPLLAAPLVLLCYSFSSALNQTPRVSAHRAAHRHGRELTGAGGS